MSEGWIAGRAGRSHDGKRGLAAVVVGALALACGSGPAFAINGGDAPRKRDGVTGATVAVYAGAPDGNPNRLTRCSGSLIGPDLILTAAHCTEGGPKGFLILFYRGTSPTKPVYVARLLARYRPDSGATLPGGVTLPRDVGTTLNERSLDLAILKMTEPARGRTPLAIGNDATTVPSSLRLAGIGLAGGVPSQMRTTRMVPVATSSTGLIVAKTQGAKACIGDSGGPVVARDSRGTYVWGVASAAYMPNPPCGEYVLVAPASKVFSNAPTQ